VKKTAAAGIIIAACTGRWPWAACFRYTSARSSGIFTLRRNLRHEGVSCNLVFDCSCDRTLVTERYAKKMGFRKLDGRVAAVGFAEATPTFGDVYEASVTDRWGAQHLLEAVAVLWIFMRLTAASPRNLVRGATPDGRGHRHLHRSGLRLLLPQYVEQEMRNRPLHIYKSAFSCGYVLKGLEPPPKPGAATVEPLEPEDESEPKDEPVEPEDESGPVDELELEDESGPKDELELEDESGPVDEPELEDESEPNDKPVAPEDKSEAKDEPVGLEDESGPVDESELEDVS
jgi:hypothetical protein